MQNDIVRVRAVAKNRFPTYVPTGREQERLILERHHKEVVMQSAAKREELLAVAYSSIEKGAALARRYQGDHNAE